MNVTINAGGNKRWFLQQRYGGPIKSFVGMPRRIVRMSFSCVSWIVAAGQHVKKDGLICTHCAMQSVAETILLNYDNLQIEISACVGATSKRAWLVASLTLVCVLRPERRAKKRWNLIFTIYLRPNPFRSLFFYLTYMRMFFLLLSNV